MALGRLEIWCNAPADAIVAACAAREEFFRAADVRWELLARKNYCVRCIRTLRPKEYVFTYYSGDQIKFWLAQCPHCKTMHWQQSLEK